ncbi:MAG: type II toxin-antitoxin system HicB family antitoxin [Spirochaetes bacterium]|jgi:predicted RNase H-like HicB family nuclease|nr:type II toxin-antitoxin system HicB family antitoxin [Spirochaetota bacterium]
MLSRSIQAALDRAHDEIIQDEEPYFGTIPGLDGVWASGTSLEACRMNLADVVEDWVFISIARGLPSPASVGLPNSCPPSEQ